MSGQAPHNGRRSLLVRLGPVFFRHRKWIVPPVFLLILFRVRPHYPRGSRSLDLWLDVVGITIALTGQLLRAVTIGYVYIRRGGMSGRLHADDLVTQGMFRHSRNPLYLGNILIVLGLLIVFNNPWAYLIGLPFVLLVYSSIVAAEEAYLLSRFGGLYSDYCREVNRWLPDLRGVSRSMEGMRFNWRRLVIKEYGSTFAWLATVVLLLAYEALVYSSFEQERLHLALLTACLVILAAGWATARYLKKSRKLREGSPLAPATVDQLGPAGIKP